MAQAREKLWNSNYIKVWTANFLLFLSFLLLTPLLPLYLKDTFHANKDMIGLVLSGYAVTALASRFVSGYIVDSFPRKRVLLICYFLFFIFFAGYFAAGTLLMFAIVRTMHGAPFGITSTSTSTVAIDTLPLSRRAEGIGLWGLSNNLATALGPSIAIWIYTETHNFDLIFALALAVSALGLILNSTIKLKETQRVETKREPFSFHSLFLFRGWSESLVILCTATSYGVLSTYLAIYGREEMGITNGTGLFFAILAAGLVLSRLIGAHSLRKGRIVQNATFGLTFSTFGYLLFATVSQPWAYYTTAIIIGLGNGHIYPAFQNMIVNLAPSKMRGTANSSLLIAQDLGMGLGSLVGGIVAELTSYHGAFWMAWGVNVIGVTFYYAYTRQSYIKNRLTEF